jgi:hypothetical protein
MTVLVQSRDPKYWAFDRTGQPIRTVRRRRDGTGILTPSAQRASITPTPRERAELR